MNRTHKSVAGFVPLICDYALIINNIKINKTIFCNCFNFNFVCCNFDCLVIVTSVNVNYSNIAFYVSLLKI